MLPDVRPVHHPKEEPRQRRHARRVAKSLGCFSNVQFIEFVSLTQL